MKGAGFGLAVLWMVVVFTNCGEDENIQEAVTWQALHEQDDVRRVIRRPAEAENVTRLPDFDLSEGRFVEPVLMFGATKDEVELEEKRDLIEENEADNAAYGTTLLFAKEGYLGVVSYGFLPDDSYGLRLFSVTVQSLPVYHSDAVVGLLKANYTLQAEHPAGMEGVDYLFVSADETMQICVYASTDEQTFSLTYELTYERNESK